MNTMYPQQPGQPGQGYTPPQYDANQATPVEYLNEIAPQGPKGRGFSRKQVAIMGSALLLGFIGLAIMVVATAGPSTSQLTQRLAARTQATSGVASTIHDDLRSSELTAANSTLRISLTNMLTQLSSLGIELNKIESTIATGESADELAATLEDARLNGVLDRTYAREMAYQLQTILTLMSQIYETSDNAQLREFLEKSYADLEPLQEQFASYDGLTS